MYAFNKALPDHLKNTNNTPMSHLREILLYSMHVTIATELFALAHDALTNLLIGSVP